MTVALFADYRLQPIKKNNEQASRGMQMCKSVFDLFLVPQELQMHNILIDHA
jgi:hypothetical protein